MQTLRHSDIQTIEPSLGLLTLHRCALMTLAYVSRHEDIPTRMHAMFDLVLHHAHHCIWIGRQRYIADALRIAAKTGAVIYAIGGV